MNWTNKKIYSDWGKVHSHVWLLLLHTSYSFGWLCIANISPSLWQDISFTSWRCHLTVAGWNIPILAATLFLSAAFAMIYWILDFNFLGTLGLDGFWKTTILIICRLVRVLQLYSPETLEGLKIWGGQLVIQDMFMKQVFLLTRPKSGQI